MSSSRVTPDELAALRRRLYNGEQMDEARPCLAPHEDRSELLVELGRRGG